MILILVNTFDLNKKESYEKYIKKQQQQPSSVTQNFFGQYFGDLEVPDQIYLTISVVEIFFFL